MQLKNMVWFILQLGSSVKNVEFPDGAVTKGKMIKEIRKNIPN